MFVILYVIISGIFLIVNYIIAYKDIFNPSVVFCGVNGISGMSCVIVSRIYDIEIHFNTLVVLTSGMFIFTAFNLIEAIYEKKRESLKISFEPSKMCLHYIIVEKYWIVLLLIFELIVAYYTFDYVRNVVGAYDGQISNVSSIIGRYNYLVKEHSLELKNLNIHSNIIYRIGTWVIVPTSLICTTIAINNYYVKKKMDYVLFIPFIVMILVSFITGSRSASFRYLTFVLSEYVIIRYRATGKTYRIRPGIILRLLLAFILLTFVFWSMLTVIGRSRNYLWYEYLIAYVGGPVFNLDHFLSGSIEATAFFGKETFAYFYSWFFGKIIRIPEMMYSLNIPYLRHNGYYMGNVYTMYYMFIEDFGYWGVLPLTSIIACYYNWSYRKLMNNRWDSVISVKLFMFCYLYNDLFMLLFSNRFYENLLRGSTIKLFICLVLLCFFIKRGLFKVNLKSGKYDVI